jgi:hypothetical protein
MASHNLSLEMGEQSNFNQNFVSAQQQVFHGKNYNTRCKIERERAKIANIVGPLGLSFGKVRAALAASSMDVFSLQQDARSIVAQIVTGQKVSSPAPSSLPKSPASRIATPLQPDETQTGSCGRNEILREWAQFAARVREEREAWHAKHDRVAKIWEEIEVSLAYAARQSGAGQDWSVEKAIESDSTIGKNKITASRPMHENGMGADEVNRTTGKSMNGEKDAPASARNALVDVDGKIIVSVFEGVASKPSKRRRSKRRLQKASHIEAANFPTPAASLKVELEGVLAHRSPLLERVRNFDRTGWSDPRQNGNCANIIIDNAESCISSNNEDCAGKEEQAAMTALGTPENADRDAVTGHSSAATGPTLNEGAKLESSNGTWKQPIERHETTVVTGDFLAVLKSKLSQSKLSRPVHGQGSSHVFET